MAAKKVEILPEDVIAGLNAVISVYVPSPTFSSQAKVKLSGKVEGDAIYSALVKEFNRMINGMTDEQKKEFSNKIVNNAKIRSAAEVAKLNKKKSISVKSPIDLPSNLSDCALAGVDNENTELYICEGHSAASTIIAARFSTYQGVLPVKGKVLNVMRIDMNNKKQRDRFEHNAEIEDMIKALGAGVGTSFDLDKRRYGRVIFACDADFDGLAISTLLLGVFYKLFRPMIEDGRVYQCVSPFYDFKYKVKGKEVVEYAMDEKERGEIEKRLNSKKIKYHLSRAKGLGELNADVFNEIVMNPKNRTLVQISMEDAKAANDMLELAIGMESADSRKEWMTNHLDVIEDIGLYE